MLHELELVARMSAYQAGRAMPIASHQQVSVREDALVLAFLAMAGEDTTMHIVALGGLGQPAELFAIPDPRNREDQAKLFGWLGERLETYIGRCRRLKAWPQLIVSSSPALHHLDAVAERWRYVKADPKARRFANLLSWFTDRTPMAGQQSLLTATGVLRRHWVTGQQPGEDEHLGALLTWMRPPVGGDLSDAVAQAETRPMGCKTDPRFDRDVLAPLMDSYYKAREEGASLIKHRQAIQSMLEPEVLRIYQGIQDAVAHLQQAGFSRLDGLEQLEEREASDFAYFMASRDQGYHLALRDSPKAAVFGFMAREDAVEAYEAALVQDDAVARAAARLSGHVLVGEVTRSAQSREGRKTIIRLDVVSDQPVLRLRPLDELAWMDNPALRVVVETVHRQSDQTCATLRVVKGQRKVGALPVGTRLELSAGPPNWRWIWTQRKQLSARLRRSPWTHDPNATIPTRKPTTSASTPSDPLAAVEALR